MKKSLLINVGLLAAVLVMGLIAWLKPSSSEPAYKLSTQKATEIKSIEVALGAAPPIVLERADSEWKITTPFAARADAFQVQRLLELLDAKASERFPAAGLARYGLNEPVARIKLAHQEIAFGAFNEMSREQYVLGGDGVYLLPIRYGASLPRNAFSLVSKQLFAADEAPIAFNFGSFKIALENSKWTLTAGVKSDIDAGPDDINRWVDDWRLASALGVQAPMQRKAIETLQVVLKNGKQVSIAVVERGTSTIITRSDQAFEYAIAEQTAQRLFAPPKTVKADPATPAK